MKRALMIAGFTLLVSLALLSYLPEKTQWIPAIIFLILGLISLIFRKIEYVKYIAFVLILVAVSGFSLTVSDYIATNNLTEHNEEESYFSGYVESVYTDGFVLKSELDGEIRAVYVKTEDASDLPIGRACRVVGELTATSDMSLNDARFYKSKGCFLVCDAKRAYAIKDSLIEYIPKFLKPIWELREKLIWHCEEYFDTDISGLMKAVLLGDKSEVTAKLEDDFKTSGLSHYIALSGQHTSIIAVSIFFVLKGINRRFAAIVTTISMLFYIFLVGLSFSVTRAGIMAMITYIGMAFFLRSDALNSLGISIIAILAFNPYSAADISFQLSVVATIGIIVISPYIDKYLEKILSKVHPKLKLKKLRNLLAITLGANIFLIPYYIFSFEEISLISPITNLVAGLLMSLPIVFGSIAIVLSTIPNTYLFFLPFKIIAEFSLRAIVAIAKCFSAIPFSSVICDQIFVKTWFIGTAVALVCLYFLGNKKFGKLAILLSLTSLFSMILCYNLINKDKIVVSVCNSYGGTSAIITDNNSCTVVANKTDDFLLYKIEKEVTVSGNNEIDLMIVAENKKTIELLDFLDKVDVKMLVYASGEIPQDDIDLLSKKVDNFYNHSMIDIKAGERMNYLLRRDSENNALFLMQLDDISITLNSGNFDLSSSYDEFRGINMFIIGNECPVGIEHFQPEEIFLTSKEAAREIYKKIHFVSENINFYDNQTLIISKNKYKCLN